MSIGTRLWLTLTVTILLVIGVEIIVRLEQERALLLETTVADRRFFGHALARTLDSSGTTDPDAAVRSIMHDDFILRGHIRVDVRTREQVREALGQFEPSETSHFEVSDVVVGVGTRGIVTLVPVGRGDFWVRFVEPFTVHEAIENVALISASVSGTALALVAGGLAWLVIDWLVRRPLRQLAEQAQRIGRGEFGTPSEVAAREDEVGRFASEMNEMAARLSDTRHQLDEAATERVMLQEALRHGDRLRSVGQLAASVAHELGTPLGTVAGYARMIERGSIEGDAAKKGARVIAEQAERMAEQIRTMLDFGRLSTSSTRIVHDLRFSARKAADMLAPLAQKHGAIVELELGETPMLSIVDPNQMLQVVTNLMMNAIESMPEGGPVVVRTSIVEHDPPADVPERSEHYVCVTIEDRGVGIEPSDLEHVFDPFFTSKSEGEGTGLGLSVVRGIVRDHGGFIEVESHAQVGTTFRVYFPAT